MSGAQSARGPPSGTTGLWGRSAGVLFFARGVRCVWDRASGGPASERRTLLGGPPLHRLIALAVLLCVACGDKTTPAADTLVVHSDWWDSVPPADDVNVTILLGDGSRFRQPLGRDGIARFNDADITGPQDITVVMVTRNEVLASTTLNVEGSEVWVRSGFGLLADLPRPRDRPRSPAA